MVGRQLKKGLDCFPLAVLFFNNQKIQFFEPEFRIRGSFIALKLLSRIYQNSYYYKWGKDEYQMFAKAASAEFAPIKVKEIVNELVRRHFFYKMCFDSFGIRTFISILQYCLECFKRIKSINLTSHFRLSQLPIGLNIDLLNSDVNIKANNVYINEQRKEKEKESKRKEKNTTTNVVASKDSQLIFSLYSEKIDFEQLIFPFHTKANSLLSLNRMLLDDHVKKNLTSCIQVFGSFIEMIQATNLSSLLHGNNLRRLLVSFNWIIESRNYKKDSGGFVKMSFINNTIKRLTWLWWAKGMKQSGARTKKMKIDMINQSISKNKLLGLFYMVLKIYYPSIALQVNTFRYREYYAYTMFYKSLISSVFYSCYFHNYQSHSLSSKIC